MAREIIQFTWCDKHMERGERRDGETIVVRIGDNVGELDLCEDCRQIYVTPLAALMSVHAKPATTALKATTTAKPAPAKAVAAKATPAEGKATGGQWWREHAHEQVECPACTRECARHYLGTHLRTQHNTSLSYIYGERCPIDGHTAKSFQGLTTHIQKAHGSGIGWPGIAQLGREAGDEHGIVAEIESRLALVREDLHPAEGRAIPPRYIQDQAALVAQ